MTISMVETSVLFILLPSTIFGLLRLDDERSSFVMLKENSRLKGHVIQKRNAASFTTCTHYCLMHTDCKSVNYRHPVTCELNNVSPNDDDNVVEEVGFTLGWWINVPLEQYIFTSLGSQGKDGPTNTHGYNGTNLEGNVQVTNGIQIWTAPVSGNYNIDVYGASGANGTCRTCHGWSIGGYGARITGTFTFKQGSQLRILIGQEGLNKLETSDSPGGGGGGTFVTLADNTPLIIAGGGGGGGVTTNGVKRDGDPGQATNNGSRFGGINGQGGQRYDSSTKTLSPNISSPTYFGGAGAGFRTDGDSFGGSRAKAFLNGGNGGSALVKGGFGGGGFPVGKSPGGGGGYCGGGVIMIKDGGLAGGGGSYNTGSHPLNKSGYNKGDGLVIFTLSA